MLPSPDGAGRCMNRGKSSLPGPNSHRWRRLVAPEDAVPGVGILDAATAGRRVAHNGAVVELGSRAPPPPSRRVPVEQAVSKLPSRAPPPKLAVLFRRVHAVALPRNMPPPSSGHRVPLDQATVGRRTVQARRPRQREVVAHDAIVERAEEHAAAVFEGDSAVVAIRQSYSVAPRHTPRRRCHARCCRPERNWRSSLTP